MRKPLVARGIETDNVFPLLKLLRRIRHRTRSLSKYSFDFIFHITALASTIPIKSSITPFVHTFFVLEDSAFPAIFTMCFLFGKQNCIIPKLNSDWLIPIKVHPSFKKNRMRFYSIKVLQSF